MLENIVNKFAQKGWNLYELGELNQNLFDVLPNGEVKTLERERNYIVLPCIRNPRDISEMLSQLEIMKKMNECPYIYLRSERIAFLFFLVKEKSIFIYSQGRNTFNHEEFYRILETLADRRVN